MHIVKQEMREDIEKAPAVAEPKIDNAVTKVISAPLKTEKPDRGSDNEDSVDVETVTEQMPGT